MNRKKIEKELEELANNYVAKKRRWTELEDELVLNFFHRVSVSDLAKKLNRTVNSVRNRHSIITTGGE